MGTRKKYLKKIPYMGTAGNKIPKKKQIDMGTAGKKKSPFIWVLKEKKYQKKKSPFIWVVTQPVLYVHVG